MLFPYQRLLRCTKYLILVLFHLQTGPSACGAAMRRGGDTHVDGRRHTPSTFIIVISYGFE
jgi:hypothetical protein